MTTIEKLSFHLDHVIIIGSMECGKTRCYYFQDNEKIEVKERLCWKFSKTTGIEI